MLDRALNERVRLPIPCLIGKLCRQGNTTPNRLVDRWSEAFRLTQTSKIKDVANHLFGAKVDAVGLLAVVPYVPIDILYANRGLEQGESSQPSTGAPPPPASASQALKKRVKYEMRKELIALKDRMDGLEVHVQDQLQAAGSVSTDEFKTQLAEIRAQISKLVEKQVHVPTPILPESLMNLFSEPPTTQSLDDFWSDLPKSKYGKRKHTADESDEERTTDLYKEEKKRNKKARRE
uniref:Integrase core domain containing protein n=1 Tax=Solanum tuberosum TaxID=4113 RepID=M1DJV8_SOLTU